MAKAKTVKKAAVRVLTYDVKKDADIPGVGLVKAGSTVNELQVSAEAAKPLMAEGVLRPAGHLPI